MLHQYVDLPYFPFKACLISLFYLYYCIIWVVAAYQNVTRNENVTPDKVVKYEITNILTTEKHLIFSLNLQDRTHLKI